MTARISLALALHNHQPVGNFGWVFAEVYDRAIDIQILRLRRKIEPDPARPRFIRTERGAGYVFSVPVDVVR